MKKLLAILPALALLAGCPSFSTLGTARTLPQGKGQFFVAPGGVVLQDFQRDSAGRYESFGLPTVEFGGRYGVTDDVEVGGKVWLLGSEIDTKFALLRSPTADAGLDVSLAPALSLYPFRSGDQNVTYAWVHLPLLVGVNLGGSQLVLGPRASGMFLSGAGDSISALWLGGSLGYAWKVGDGFRLLPEVSVAWPAHVKVGADATTSLEPKGAMIQGSLGLLFGGD